MKAAVVLVCLIIGCAFALRPEEQKFVEFMKKFGKSYATHEEFTSRFANFKVCKICLQYIPENSASEP
jgi:hypothetical protein